MYYGVILYAHTCIHASHSFTSPPMTSFLTHHPVVFFRGTGAAAWAPAPARSPRSESLRRAAGPANAPLGTSCRCSDGFPTGAAYLVWVTQRCWELLIVAEALAKWRKDESNESLEFDKIIQDHTYHSKIKIWTCADAVVKCWRWSYPLFPPLSMSSPTHKFAMQPECWLTSVNLLDYIHRMSRNIVRRRCKSYRLLLECVQISLVQEPFMP